jgi:hypothetical protein
MPIARSKPPVPPNTSLLFGHNATALLPHRASYRRNIRLRIGQRAYSDRLLDNPNSLVTSTSQTVLIPAAAGWCSVRASEVPAPFLFVTPARSPDQLATRLLVSGIAESRIDAFSAQFLALHT